MPADPDRTFDTGPNVRSAPSQAPHAGTERGFDSHTLQIERSAFRFRLARYARLRGRAPTTIGVLMKKPSRYEPGMHLLSQGESGGKAFLIKSGWTYTSSSKSSGARQVHDVQIPGDIAGLHGLVMPFTLYDVTAMTRVEVCELSVDHLVDAMAEDPELSPFLLWLLACEHAVAGERLIDLGRRTAIERIAHFILELATRLKLAGTETSASFVCPMTHYLIGDALGLTSVHVNRMLRDLKAAGLVQHHCGSMHVMDRAGLVSLAKFDSTYLDCSLVRD